MTKVSSGFSITEMHILKIRKQNGSFDEEKFEREIIEEIMQEHNVEKSWRIILAEILLILSLLLF